MMKAKGGLFVKIGDYHQLSAAAWNAARGKQHRSSVIEFFANFETEIEKLSTNLKSSRYQFGKYSCFQVRDPKLRTIHAPCFRDRVVHHSMISALGATFELGEMEHSYACRKGKGQHQALNQVKKWARRDRWFLKIDVARFYDSISHRLLLDRLQRRFRENRLIDLFEKLLSSYYKHQSGYGIPIVALTSQYLGNFYLDPIDHHIRQSCNVVGHVRYMDDLLLIGERQPLIDARNSIEASLADLGLTIKNGGVLNRCCLGIPYLGFTLYPDRIRLDRRGRKRLRHKWRLIETQFNHQQLSEVEYSQRLTALFAHSQLADDIAWRRHILSLRNFGERSELDRRCSARRFVEQFRQELPLCVSQQEQGRQSQQEQRLSCLSGSWHGDHSEVRPPDDVVSRASAHLVEDESLHKPPFHADICSEIDFAGRRKDGKGPQ